MPDEPKIFTIDCSGERHDIVVTDDGELIPLDHDLETELAAITMGANKPQCLRMIEYFGMGETRDPFELGLVLSEAAKIGDVGLAKLLFRLDADIHADSDLPLKLAAWHGHLHFVQYLLEIGGDEFGSLQRQGAILVAMSQARQRGHRSVYELLMEWCEDHDIFHS